MKGLEENFARVRERVAQALERANRPPGSVTIIAVTKTFGAETVRAAIDVGIQDIGENRVQELLAKAPLVGEACRWHLVGPLQRNKAGKAVDLVHRFHAIESVRVADTLGRLALERESPARVLLEVNISGEASKHGVQPREAAHAAEAIAQVPGVELLGLMTIGPTSTDVREIRSCFRALARLASDLRSRTGLALPELSMGMSEDFEIAVEEGATAIRLGRILFGERPVSPAAPR